MAKREYILDYTAEEINEGIGKALTRDNLSDFMDDSEHRLVTDDEKNLWNGKQDVLTLDDNPTPDSDNPVKSSGIHRQLGNVFNSLNSLINSQVEGLRGQMSGMYNSLDNSKQDKFIVGNGLELVNNTLNVVLDTDIFVIVQSLPTTDISDNKIYLVLSTTQGQDNIYTEYVHKNGAWEKIGEYKADIDLTPYLTKNEASSTYATKAQIPTVPTKVSAFENDSNYLVDQGDGRYGCVIYGNGREYENTMIKNSLNGHTTIDVNPVGVNIDTTNTTEGGGDVTVTTPSGKGLIVNNKYVITEHQDISGKADISSLATVATSGSYNDLSDKPTISDDSNLVHKTGDELIQGAKTFTGLNITPTGSAFIRGTMTIDDAGGSGKIVLTGDDYTWSQIQSGKTTLQQALDAKANTASLATVATSGSYNDLSNKPTIPSVPTNVSAFTNDANYLVDHNGVIFTSNDNTTIVDASQSHSYINVNPNGITLNTSSVTLGGHVVIQTPAGMGLLVNGNLVQNKVRINSASGTSLTAAENTYYRFDNKVNTLAVTLPAITSNTYVVSIILNFTTGTTPALTITSANNTPITYYDGYSIVANTSYELNIMFNGSKWIVAYGIIG